MQYVTIFLIVANNDYMQVCFMSFSFTQIKEIKLLKYARNYKILHKFPKLYDRIAIMCGIQIWTAEQKKRGNWIVKKSKRKKNGTNKIIKEEVVHIQTFYRHYTRHVHVQGMYMLKWNHWRHRMSSQKVSKRYQWKNPRGC